MLNHRDSNKLKVDIISAITAGTLCSIAFNPWDRALHLSIKYDRKFLSADNFKNPYQGFKQVAFHRTFVNGFYNFLQSQVRPHIYAALHDQLKFSEFSAQFCVGMASGAIYALVAHPLATIKYYTWGNNNRNFFSSTAEMWKHGGVKSFKNGAPVTIARDMAYGSTYEILRHLFRAKFTTKHDKFQQFLCDASASGMAAIAASPLNYVRSKQLGTDAGKKAPTIRQALKQVWQESKAHKSVISWLRFYQLRFGIGWGTARVAVGMGASQLTFGFFQKQLTPYFQDGIDQNEISLPGKKR